MSHEFDLIIRNGSVVAPNGVISADLAILQDRIAAIEPDLDAKGHEIDATGYFVMPGGIDPHCHIEQLSGLGVLNADTFETATRSAALGGTSSVISFAAQQKGQRLDECVKEYAVRARRGAMIDYAFHMSISDTSVPNFYEDLHALIDAGHRSIKIYSTYEIKLNDRDMLNLMESARKQGALICVHAENDGMISWTRDALVSTGLTDPKFHAVSHPRLAEIEAVERMCRFSEFMAAPVMLFHISTAESLEVIQNAQARGVPVWAETCPHYLFMTESVLDREGLEGAKWMCSPPQRDTTDQRALWAAINEQVLSVVSSDHAPYRFDASGKLSAGSKAGFHQIANGLPGLQTRLPLLFDAIVSRGLGGPEKFAELTATAPARIYGLPRKGRLEVGMDADIAIWDPDLEQQYGSNDLADNVGYNPWIGHRVKGMPIHVLSRGEFVVQNSELRSIAGRGRWLSRTSGGFKTKAIPAPEIQVVEQSG